MKSTAECVRMTLKFACTKRILCASHLGPVSCPGLAIPGAHSYENSLTRNSNFCNTFTCKRSLRTNSFDRQKIVGCFPGHFHSFRSESPQQILSFQSQRRFYGDFSASTCSTFSSTIFSLSSGHGKCGVSVIRVSGSHAGTALKMITKRKTLPKARKAVLRTLYHPSTQLPLDKAMILWFSGPQSFTGEDICELHTHGGPAVVSAVLEALASIPGLRHAEPGEYTKRAFQNGKMDLVEVEGLADLIHAETEFQRQQALRQMDGDLSQIYMRWRTQLIKCVANIEAYIDFSEEDNIEDNIMSEVSEAAGRLCQEIASHLKDNRKGERLRNGVQVAIVGRPNVGKSSLLNYLCRRPAAIVSSVAGTTRDVIESAINIGGYPVVLSDTAGLRQTSDIVEVEGVSRARKRAEESDLVILVIDVNEDEQLLASSNVLKTGMVDHLRNVGCCMPDKISDELSWPEQTGDSLKDIIVLLNKVDLLKNKPERISFQVELSAEEQSVSARKVPVCCVSCTSEDGMTEFLEVLKEKVKWLCGNPNVGNPSLTQARHRSHLEECVDALSIFEGLVDSDLVLAAQELRKALRQLGKVTGQVSSEEILDVIFRDFCIGK